MWDVLRVWAGGVAAKVSGHKRMIFVLGIALLLFIVSIVLNVEFMQANRTPEECLDLDLKESSLLPADRVLFQTYAGLGKQDMVLLFYENDNGLSCAIYQHGITGYHLLEISSFLSATKEHEKGEQHMASWICRGKSGVLLWGVLYDKSIVDVTIEGESATIVSTNGLRLWYGLFDDQVDIHSVRFLH